MLTPLVPILIIQALSAALAQPLLHPNLLLNLLVEGRQRPRLVAHEDILPLNARIPTHQDILVHAPPAPTKRHGSPLALPSNLQLHASPDGLRDAECAAQTLHLQLVLRLLPFLEAGLQGVRRVGKRGRLRGRELRGRGTNAGAQRVVDSGRGWSADGFGLEMRVRAGMASGRCDSHRLGGSAVMFGSWQSCRGRALYVQLEREMKGLTMLISYVRGLLQLEEKLLMEMGCGCVCGCLESCELLKLQAERDASRLASATTTSAAAAAVLATCSFMTLARNSHIMAEQHIQCEVRLRDHCARRLSCVSMAHRQLDHR